MALIELDRRLLDGCLNHEPLAWQEFVDRFMGVFIHVIRHAARMRSITLEQSEIDDLAGEVFHRLVENDYRILRHFRGKSSLPTYLVVVARRVVVNLLARKAAILHRKANRGVEEVVREAPPDLRVENQEEVEHLLERLKGREGELIRGFYLDHKSYEELGAAVGIPTNSVGPTLHRILKRLRKASQQT